MKTEKYKHNLVARAIAIATVGSSITIPVIAQEAQGLASIETIEVTATRRAGSIQDVPINIAALDGAALEEKGIGDISEVLRFVPGIVAIDQGGRNGSP